jgi:anion transporter
MRAPSATLVRGALTALVAGALCLAIAGAPDLPPQARTALMVFVLTIAAWTGTRLPETTVALAGGIALVLFGAIEAERLFSGLGEDVVWLLIGAFIMAAVVRQSGLAERLVLRAVAGSGSVRGLFHRLTWLIVATAFVIPSTSGRAALLLPVFAALATAIDDARVVRALALLFPTTILLSACASLLGAGAHLIAVDFMAEMDLRELGFIDWALIGTPFAVVTSLIATELILRLFLDAPRRGAAPAIPTASPTAMDRPQRRIVITVCLVIALWASTAVHGMDPALIAMLGAMALASRRLSGVSMKEAVKQIEWNLILFLAATLVLGEALLDSGAADWIANRALERMPALLLAHPAGVVVIAALVSMLSHLLIHSRSARAAVLIPTLALPLMIAPDHAAALIVIVVIGSGFCQTFRVSAKPVAIYHGQREPGLFSDADLLRLSLWLMAPFAIALVLFGLYVWPLLGLSATH